MRLDLIACLPHYNRGGYTMKTLKFLLAISFFLLVSIPSAESEEVVVLSCTLPPNSNQILVDDYSASSGSPDIGRGRPQCAQALAVLLSANFKIEYVNLKELRFVLVRPR